MSTDSSSRSAAPNGWLVAILLVLVGALLFRLFDNVFGKPGLEPRTVTPRGDLAEDEKSTIDLFRTASPSVVHITSQLEPEVNLRATEVRQGSGSGFVWDEAGHVVTNYHVVRNASRIVVTLDGGESFEATVVGRDPDHDLAVLHVDADPQLLAPVPIGTSADLQVGQKVFAIGNPFGLDHTLTTGVISGLGREIDSVTKRPIQGVIQTDAAINPGNSGGPLLDSAGRLIGVNTAIFSPSGAYAGVGFAVPVDTVNDVVPQLVAHGQVDRPGLGVVIWPDELVEQLLQRQILPRAGVLLRVVAEDGAAERAGLRGTIRRNDGNFVWGDLVVEVEGRDIRVSRDLFRVLDDHEVADTVQVTVLRGDQRTTVPVTLQSLPPADE